MSYRLSDKDFRPNDHNLYFLFGLKTSATPADIKTAYRRLTRKYHPDFHDGNSQFQHAFAIINNIYSILINDGKRLDYNKIYRRKIMALNWQYNANDFEDRSSRLVPPGLYRVRIQNAEEQISRNTGNQMIKLTLEVSGYSSKVWKYQVLDNSSREAEKRTNRMLGVIFDSFGIASGNLDLDDWIGCCGGARIDHSKDNNGQERAEVSYFLYRKEVDKLPPWQEYNDIQSTGNIDPDTVDFGGNIADIPF